MQLAETFLIPDLLHGSKIFANCDDRRKLNLVYNNIARYVNIYHNFLTGCNGMNLSYVLNIKCLILIHRTITMELPIYLFRRIRFAISKRCKKIIKYRYRTTLSQRKFFIHITSLWNLLHNYIQNRGSPPFAQNYFWCNLVPHLKRPHLTKYCRRIPLRCSKSVLNTLSIHFVFVSDFIVSANEDYFAYYSYYNISYIFLSKLMLVDSVHSLGALRSE